VPEAISLAGQRASLYKVAVAGRSAANPKLEDVLTIKEAAEILGVSEMTLRRWDAAGKFPARRHPMNNYRTYLRADVETLVRQIVRGGCVRSSQAELAREGRTYEAAEELLAGVRRDA
jgi:excisionase family DNA binding protein